MRFVMGDGTMFIEATSSRFPSIVSPSDCPLSVSMLCPAKVTSSVHAGTSEEPRGSVFVFSGLWLSREFRDKLRVGQGRLNFDRPVALRKVCIFERYEM